MIPFPFLPFSPRKRKRKRKSYFYASSPFYPFPLNRRRLEKGLLQAAVTISSNEDPRAGVQNRGRSSSAPLLLTFLPRLSSVDHTMPCGLTTNTILVFNHVGILDLPCSGSSSVTRFELSLDRMENESCKELAGLLFSIESVLVTESKRCRFEVCRMQSDSASSSRWILLSCIPFLGRDYTYCVIRVNTNG